MVRWKDLLIDIERGRVYWAEREKWRSDLSGQEAGGLHSDSKGLQYWAVYKGRRAIRRARLVFYAAHGRWPSPLVDHINRDTLDDRAVNLREATYRQNAWNRRPITNKKTTLPRGVRVQRNGRYQAQIQHAGLKQGLGTFDSIAEAHAAHEAARRRLFGSFA